MSVGAHRGQELEDLPRELAAVATGLGTRSWQRLHQGQPTFGRKKILSTTPLIKSATRDLTAKCGRPRDWEGKKDIAVTCDWAAMPLYVIAWAALPLYVIAWAALPLYVAALPLYVVALGELFVFVT